MAVEPAAKAVVVMGLDGVAVARAVARRRAAGERVAGYIGEDEAEAAAMGLEMLGAVDEVVRV